MQHRRFIFLVIFCASAFLFFAGRSSPVFADEGMEANEEITTPGEITGQVIEISTTQVPTNVVIVDSLTSEHVTVDILEESAVSSAGLDVDGNVLDATISGDTITITGFRNENTHVFEAKRILNRSVKRSIQRTINGWVTAIGSDFVTITWKGKESIISIASSTRVVIPPKVGAPLTDVKIGDRVRARVHRGGTDGVVIGDIILILRRGDDIFLKGRNRVVHGEITSIEGMVVPTTMVITLRNNPQLKMGDVNNLVGLDAEEKIVHLTEDTHFVRKFSGRSGLEEFAPGDHVMIVGRANDDSTMTAKLVKNTDIWRVAIGALHGMITSVDATAKTLVIQQEETMWTIQTDTKTKIFNQGTKEEASFADFVPGMIISGRGVVNKNTKVITAQQIVIAPSLLQPDDLKKQLKPLLKERVIDRLERVRDRLREKFGMKPQSSDDEGVEKPSS